MLYYQLHRKGIFMEPFAGYRRTPQGNLQMYMNIRSAGIHTVDKTWHDSTFRHTYGQLLWCNSGTFRLEDCPVPGLLHTNEVCFLFPGDYHKISAIESGELCWVSFDGPNVQLIINNFALRSGFFTAGVCPKHLFLELIEEINTRTPESEFLAGATAYRILSVALAGQYKKQESSQLYRRFLDLLVCHFSNPDLGIEDYAKSLQCHRSTLMRLMQKYHNCTPIEYLRNMRLKKAQTLLKTTSLSIKEISLKCGFQDPDYFAKVFRSRFGKNPSDFR